MLQWVILLTFCAGRKSSFSGAIVHAGNKSHGAVYLQCAE